MRKLITAGVAAAMLAGVAGAAAAQPVVVERYGHWDNSWGAPPPPPMRHWRGHRADWYGHVHGCMTRYTTYNPRTDMYRVHNRWVPCR